MSFHNPRMPWTQLEGALSGRKAKGRRKGGESPGKKDGPDAGAGGAGATVAAAGEEAAGRAGRASAREPVDFRNERRSTPAACLSTVMVHLHAGMARDAPHSHR